ncbi:MAG TPA: hypothetical protein VFE07_15935 [Marmoricola sp.]|nr:hypothetical protein [Marmoricola sp.]
MSDLTFPPPQQKGPEQQIPMWLILGLVVVMILAGGLVGYVLLSQKHDKEAGPTYPTAWDARILPYVEIAEKERGLTFLHPVAVRFLGDKEFEKAVTSDKSKLDKDQRKELEQVTGLFRALGLLAGNVDLFDAFNAARGAGTLAYYSSEDHEIVIRGRAITPAGRPTVVHELTHVLQDQHFLIGDRLEKLQKANAKHVSTEYDVFDAIVEGDATRVEADYVKTLPAAQQRALAATQEQQSKDAYRGIPKVVVTMFTSPYALGQAMVQAAAATGGNAAVDALFRDPPTHDSVMLDPLAGLDTPDRPDKVAVPALRSGEKEFESGEFGALSLYFVLAERMPVVDALAAIDGWNGDAFVGFDRNGTTCVRSAVRGDTDQATARLLGALRTWAAGSPGSSAKVARDGALVRFESCDPGTKTALGRDASIQALQTVTIRSQLGAEFVKAGLPTEAARCSADTVVRSFPFSTLTASKLSAADTNRVRSIVLSCR